MEHGGEEKEQGEVGKGRKRRGEEKEKRERVLFLLFRLRAIVRTYVCVYACMRAPSRRESVCYGEAVTHPAREGEGERDEDERERERERVLFPWQEAASGGGDRYIDSRNVPAASRTA